MPRSVPLSDVPAVVLCGGRGTRLGERTKRIPKPMVTIGGQPVLWHLVRYYASFGVRRFILCLGYKADVIRSWAERHPIAGVEVACVDTGEEAMTGARVKRVEHHLGDSDIFLCTYGDGLADVDISELIAFHRSHGRLATVTGVHPPSRFGELEIEGDSVVGFAEKPPSHQWINGGFFACTPRLFDELDDDDSCVLERDPFERMAKSG
ncbi:MAG TPA: sugar phosphate nucleotidyltransferase, partial [Acidimicrobiales bacterium]|nr:sugar phosphate nucleotidyltransferase [Acidimicrobiales bacterium]